MSCDSLIWFTSTVVDQSWVFSHSSTYASFWKVSKILNYQFKLPESFLDYILLLAVFKLLHFIFSADNAWQFEDFLHEWLDNIRHAFFLDEGCSSKLMKAGYYWDREEHSENLTEIRQYIHIVQYPVVCHCWAMWLSIKSLRLAYWLRFFYWWGFGWFRWGLIIAWVELDIIYSGFHCIVLLYSAVFPLVLLSIL